MALGEVALATEDINSPLDSDEHLEGNVFLNDAGEVEVCDEDCCPGCVICKWPRPTQIQLTLTGFPTSICCAFGTEPYRNFIQWTFDIDGVYTLDLMCDVAEGGCTVADSCCWAYILIDAATFNDRGAEEAGASCTAFDTDGGGGSDTGDLLLCVQKRYNGSDTQWFIGILFYQDGAGTFEDLFIFEATVTDSPQGSRNCSDTVSSIASDITATTCDNASFSAHCCKATVSPVRKVNTADVGTVDLEPVFA